MAFPTLRTDNLTDAEAEGALLWECAQNPHRFNEIAILDPDDFSLTRYGGFYKDVMEQLAHGRVLDNQLLTELLSRYEVEGEPLHRYLQRVTIGQRPPSVPETARHIRELSMFRRARKAAEVFMQEIEAHESPLDHIMNRLNSDLAKLTEYAAAQAETFRYEDHTDKMIEIARGESEDLQTRPTGIQGLDNIIHGFAPGDVVVAAAPSGMGKSAFGGEIALNFALRGEGVLYVTAEMPGEQLAARNTSSLIRRNGGDNNGERIPYAEILSGKQEIADLDRVVRTAMTYRKELPIQTIGARSGITVAEVARRAQAYSAELEMAGGRLGLIVIDHIGLLMSDNPRHNIYERTTQISNSIAGLARQMRVPTLILAQVTKNVEKTGNGKATAADIRDSGAVRQDANIILALHRPRAKIESLIQDDIDTEIQRDARYDTRPETLYLEKSTSGPSYLAVIGELEGDEVTDFDDLLDDWKRLHDTFEISVEKNRNGETGRVVCSVDIECNRIY